ncbi:hypothetical protein K438DRAFT_2010693 [Mycena galopus ATCC 62051]|nr:hypothetical protein K438DRAFT_2010693 [Mycena galopus ATCC 62051]
MFFSAAVTILASSLVVVAQYGNPAPAGPTSTAPAAAPSAPPSNATDINVNVSPNGQFMFDPAEIVAPVNATVTFWFPASPTAHSVTQSSFDAPCTFLAATSNNSAGFDSGLTTAKQFTITITNASEPIWFHCKQFTHCGMGMVGSINAPTNGTNTFAAFQAAASKIGLSEPLETDTGAVTGGFNAVATNSPTATGAGAGSASSGIKAVASVGALLLGGLAMGAMLLW